MKCKPAEVYFTDNQAVIDWCHSQYIDSDAQWQGVLNQVIGHLASEERGATEIRWVPTQEQRADKLTKFIAVSYQWEGICMYAYMCVHAA